MRICMFSYILNYLIRNLQDKTKYTNPNTIKIENPNLNLLIFCVHCLVSIHKKTFWVVLLENQWFFSFYLTYHVLAFALGCWFQPIWLQIRRWALDNPNFQLVPKNCRHFNRNETKFTNKRDYNFELTVKVLLWESFPFEQVFDLAESNSFLLNTLHEILQIFHRHLITGAC